MRRAATIVAVVVVVAATFAVVPVYLWATLAARQEV